MIAAIKGFLGLQDLRGLGRSVRLALRTVGGAGRSLVAATAAVSLLSGLVPVAMAVAMANIIGAAPGVARLGIDGPSGRRLVVATWAYVALLTAQGLLGSVVSTASQWVSRQLDGRLRERAMRAALAPVGVRHLEDETMRQALDQARTAAPTHGMTPGVIASMLPSVVGGRVRILAHLIGLTYLSWPLGLAFALVTLKVQDEMQKGVWRVAGAGGGLPPPPVGYDLELASGAAAAKEVRVFGLGQWLSDRYATGMRAHMDGVWSRRRDFTPSLVATLLACAALNIVAIVVLGNSAVRGALGVGELAFGLVSVMALNPGGAFNQDDMPLAFAATVIERIEAAEAVVAAPELRLGGTQAADGMPARSLRFEGVGFRYPGTERQVLRGLDLELRAGERTALVGLNGAGKTTLVKLLCGLYEPTAGRIVLDDHRLLRETDPVSWRSRLAVLFQDFARFELAARDNVRYGAVAWRPADADAALRRAASMAGIEAAIAGLPAGWESPLAPGYPDGSSLSGGQWQRVALARALYAVESGARVLVLDEPTANLDVRAEAEIYETLLALTKGALADEQGPPLTTLLISHRFSTVRQADRIVVLSGGRIAEDGTHGELLQRGGIYAQMFLAQAEQFAREPAAADGAEGKAEA